MMIVNLKEILKCFTIICLVNSSIIIHDYRDLNLDKKNIKLNLKNGDDRPLGKEQIVYRYVNYLMDSNLISFDKIVGYIPFLQKNVIILFTIKKQKRDVRNTTTNIS